MSQDPLDPVDRPGLAPPPLSLDAPVRSTASSLPSSLVPESVRQRAAFDLPFAIDPGGLSAPVGGEASAGGFDGDTEGVPVGLPDFSSLMGLESPTEAPSSSAVPWEPPELPGDLGEDEEVMALPSPSMIEPSPFGPDISVAEELDDEEEGPSSGALDADFGSGLMPPTGDALYSEVTEQEQLPPTPVFPERVLDQGFGPQVPAQVMVDALAELESRHMQHIFAAFLLGVSSSVVGFVAARWALVSFGS